MNDILRTDPEELKKASDGNVLKRVSQPDEQAGMAVFLLSDHASCQSPLDHHQLWLTIAIRYHRCRAHDRWRSHIMVDAHCKGTVNS
jgi:hypothetical protein